MRDHVDNVRNWSIHLSIKLHGCEHGMELKHIIIYNIFYNGAQFMFKNARFRSK